MAAAPILLGVIGRPHGVRGLLHVHSYTGQPEDLTAYGTLMDDAGRRFRLTWIGGDVAELTEITPSGDRRITDRDAAARLTNTRLHVDRDALPPPDDADEFYLADLIGLAAVTSDGTELGQVTVLHDYGAGPSVEISGNGASVLVPFTRACVPEIDLAGRRLLVRLPAETAGEPGRPVA